MGRDADFDPLRLADPDALAAVVRLDTGPGAYDVDYENFDIVLFINLSDVVLDSPMLRVTGQNLVGDLQALKTGGIASDSRFGGSGVDAVLQGLAPGEIWATLIPDTNPGGLNTNDFFKASVGGTIAPIDGVELVDGEVAFITAPRPVVSNLAELEGLQAIAVSLDGLTVYGINTAENALVVANAGDLGQRQFFQDGVDGVNGLGGASDVEVSPDGLNVYVTGANDRTVAVFTRDPATGDLVYNQSASANTTFNVDEYDALAISADGSAVVTAGSQGLQYFDRL